MFQVFNMGIGTGRRGCGGKSRRRPGFHSRAKNIPAWIIGEIAKVRAKRCSPMSIGDELEWRGCWPLHGHPRLAATPLHRADHALLRI